MLKNASYTINKQRICVFMLLISSCLLAACSETESDPENEIREYIENAKLTVESRSHNDTSELIHDSYLDQQGLNKQTVTSKLRAYFFIHKNIHLFTQIESIDLRNENEAFVIVHVAMAANAIADINSLSSLRARVYRFELLLVKDETWLVKQAKWQIAKIKDLL